MARGRTESAPWGWRAQRLARRCLGEPILWLLIVGSVIAHVLSTAGSWRVGAWQLTQAWLVAELLFLAFQYFRYRTHNRVGAHPVPHHDPEETFSQFLQLNAHITIQPFLSGWFHGANFEEIKRENVEELICYGFYYKSRGDVVGTAVEGRLREHVCEVEAAFGVVFPDGYNPSLRFMSHLWEPLAVVGRPLLFYGVTEAVGALSHAALLAAGFRRHRQSGVAQYWIRSAAGGAALQEQPLVFMHGVGFGLLPYFPFLRRLRRALPTRTLILAEYRHVTMRLCWDSPHVDELVYDLADLLQGMGCRQACVMGHSYGTLVMTRFMQLCPDSVGSAVMIDPVSLMVLHPKLLHNFVYRRSPLRSSDNIHKDILVSLVASEITIAETMCRKFWWHIFMTWPQLLPPSTIIVLSALDRLVPMPEVTSLLSKTHAEVMTHPEHHHGDFLFDASWQDEIIARMAKFPCLLQAP